MAQENNQNGNGPLKACGNCSHFFKFGAEPKGSCYAHPPTIFASGYCERPRVNEKDRACGEHLAGVPMVKEKVQPETVGAALKSARLTKGRA